MTISNKTKKAGLLLGIIVTLTIVTTGVLLLGMQKPIKAKPILPEEHLFIDATYLLKTDETNESVNITCDLYMTNIWEKKSGDIKAVAYVIETGNNFAVFKNSVEIGEIKADSTESLEIPLVLSNNSYKVEILLFEKDKLVIKGKVTINAHPVYRWEEVTHDDGDKSKVQVLEEWSVGNSAIDFHQIR